MDLVAVFLALPPNPVRIYREAAFLFTGYLLLLLPFVGMGDIFQVSEGREGVVVNEILASGELVLPLRNGEIVPSKPIFFHWLGALTAKVTGQYTEFELRFPSACAGAVVASLTFVLGAALLGRGWGLVLSAMLFLTASFFQLSLDGRVDMLFNALIMIALVNWIVEYDRVRKEQTSARDISVRAMLATSIACGFAVLTKGPLGIVLPGLLISAFVLVFEGKRGFWALFRWEWIFALLIPLPWYLLASSTGSSAFVQRQLIFENVARFFGGEGITPHPPWYYLATLPGEALPWSIFYVVALVWAWRKSTLPSWRSSGDAYRYGAIWFLVGLIFFSLSVGKRAAYVVPLLPGLFLATVAWLERLSSDLSWNDQTRLFRRWIYRLGVGFLLFTTTVWIAPMFFPPSWFEKIATSPKAEVAVAAYFSTIEGYGLFFLILLLALNFGAFFAWRAGFREQDAKKTLLGVFLALYCVLAVFVCGALVLRGKTHSYKPFAAQLTEFLREHPEFAAEKINMVKTVRDESFDGFFFYFRKHVKMISPEAEQVSSGVWLARRSWMERRPNTRLYPVLLQGGRRTDTPQQQLILFYVP